MIQQINQTPAPQQTPAQLSQSKENIGGFQILLKKTVNALNSKDTKQTNSPDPKTKDDKATEQQTNLLAIPAGTDASALAAMLQPVNVQAQPASQNVLSAPQLPVLQAIEAPGQTAEVSAGKQQVGLIQGAVIPTKTIIPEKTVDVQQGNILSAVQQTPAATVKNSSEQQQVNPAIPDLVQGETKESAGTNSPLPVTVQSKTVQASPQGISPVQQNITQAAAQTKQPADSVSEPIASTGQANVQTLTATIIPTAEPTVVQTVVPTVVPTEQTVGSDSKSISTAQLQMVLPKDEKTKIPVQAAVNQNQSSARFTDLFQNGNVVIKVSDASSDSAKTAFSQITDQIAVNYKAGNPQFQMELHPQNLGKVSVKLSMQSGILTVEIAAANPKTQSMLMASSDQIKSVLQSTVDQPVRVLEPAPDKLWYQQQDQSSQSQSQQQEKQQQHRNVISYLNSQDSDITTGDFLTVMQQLRQQAYSV